MIQIEDLVVIAAILAFFLLCVFYLIYFIISKKLFPKVTEFQKEINPNKHMDVLKIKGSGIVKKIEMQVSESNNSLIVMVVDGTAYNTFNMVREANNLGKISFSKRKDRLLKLEVNLDKKFHRDFSLFIDNKGDGPLSSAGKIQYEIKEPLSVTLRYVFGLR